MSQKTEADVAGTIGIDTGKNTLHLIGLDDGGTIVLREKLGRSRIGARLANVPRCLIGIEAGMATHYVARELIALGHDVRQVPPVYARPFRQAHKNDFRDAYAIAEAVQRPSTRFVPVKTDDQLDLQALHRVRSRLIGERTAVINQIRGFLLERGIAVRQGLRFLRQQLPEILVKRIDVLSPRMIRIVEDLSGDWRRLDERIELRHGRDRTTGTWQRELPAVDDRSGHRPDHRQRHGRSHWQWRCFCQRTRLCRPARLSAEADVDGRSDDPWAHQQARQSLSTHAVHAGRPRYFAQTSKLGKA